MGAGMLPGPYVYGIVQDAYPELDPSGINVSRAGMYCVFFSSIAGCLFLFLALLLRERS